MDGEEQWLKIRDNKIIKIQNTYTHPERQMIEKARKKERGTRGQG